MLLSVKYGNKDPELDQIIHDQSAKIIPVEVLNLINHVDTQDREKGFRVQGWIMPQDALKFPSSVEFELCKVTTTKGNYLVVAYMKDFFLKKGPKTWAAQDHVPIDTSDLDDGDLPF